MQLEIKPQPAQQKFLESSDDIAIYGGAAGGGKSYALLFEPIFHRENPKFHAVIFRRTYPQIMQPGGLWDQSEKIYPYFRAEPNKSEMTWKFPSGARVRFAHLQHEKNVFDWMGSEVPLFGFDELTHFTQDQFWYLLSRNRSLCGVRPYVRATCNPDADSWVASLLAWWIDPKTGLPIPERAGKARWFVRVHDALEWADDPRDLRRRYPEIPAKSLSFFPARLVDNLKLMQADPAYLANLLALPLVERERLLGGNWLIRSSAGLVFNRDWFVIMPIPPVSEGSRKVRAWDKAGTAGAGDYTAGVLMARHADGTYVVEDVVRGQWGALERNRIIQETAKKDGPGVGIWLEQEPGSGGKESAELSIKQLAGYLVYAERVTGDKLTRARQFAAQVQARNVSVVQAPWTEAFLSELHRFDGTDGGQDDQVDAAALAFNKLALGSVGTWDYNPPESAWSVWKNAPEGVFLS